MSSNEGFQALLDLAAKTRTNSLPIPAEGDEAPRQSGIGFSLLGRRFIAPMGQIAEMLEIPPSTRLPGVQPWVIGLANVRGRLLPLFDMAVFFGGTSLGQRRQQRALVIDTDQLYSGLVVDQAYGMQHFTSDLYKEHVDDVPDAVAPFVKGGYVDASGVSWALFDMYAIANFSKFMNAASA
ncbi:chemotaxis protein CheW [Marinagarivorans cellulosilyticus]|uniref:Twitching motility protein PilI n=1 Tax=Marinagarivorans cellulosilyticus TaxID=2721545 RepID=A0AAN2BKG9_9GAMM|nr:chemotaxis protein CheW [Marinagarivorans cellulosilyticus]BCD98014.1 twitching motility protein PilI [Marinagarivorans cellulosilyticus]